MKYITTKEAAERCGVSKTTIQTLVREGVFNYMRNGKMYVIAEDDVVKYAEKVRKVEKANKSIDEYLEEREQIVENIKNERKEAEDALSAIGLYPARVTAIKNVLYQFLALYGHNFTYAEREIIDDCLEGRFFSNIAQKKGYTRQCAFTMYHRALYRIAHIKRHDEELEERIKMLERENGMLRRELVEKRGGDVSNVKEDVEPLLNMKITDMSISVRLMNVCKMSNIETITELAMKSEMDLLKTRLFGKKSYEEVKKVLCEHGLHLGMTLDEIILNIR